MKIFGLVILVVGAVFSFGASKWVAKVKKSEEVTDREVVVTKLVGLLIAVIGVLIVFYG